MSAEITETAETTETTSPPHHCDSGPGDHSAGSTHGYITEKNRYLTRLKRAEGQVRGVQRMVDEEQYCIDIVTQISALTSALENVALALINDHLAHCVADAAQAGGKVAQDKLKEASDAIARLIK